MVSILWIIFELQALEVLASTILADSRIVQVVPPEVKYGVNHEAFDNQAGS